MAALVASIYRGISYRGAEGQWAWILHRASGLGIVLFLYMHIVSIFIAAIGRSRMNGSIRPCTRRLPPKSWKYFSCSACSITHSTE